MASEEVLLIVNHVKLKKSVGRLYMMGQRMAWMQQSSDKFSVTHFYADIRVQKISPDSKDKVQLQVVLHDGGAMTFHFCNPAGREAQQEDREGVKELLQQLLPKFRKKVNSELEEKNRMLQEDPELFQLYKDLVVSGIVTPDEFWSNRNVGKNSSSKPSKQEVGVSAAFMSDIKQTDGCNGLKYNLTADTIEAIFRTYPQVQRKHAENVPDKLTESEFWTKFFQSHYFHRDRLNFGNKEIFADCAKQDEQNINEEKQKGVKDSFVDLLSMSDGIQGDGYGIDNLKERLGSVAANSSLIRRFNHHSTMVLKACDKPTTSEKSIDNPLSGAPMNSQSASQTNGKSPEDSTEQPPSKKVKLKEKIQYDDLRSAEENLMSKNTTLRLTKMDRYLHGPTPASAIHYSTSEDVLNAHQAVMHEMMAWKTNQSAKILTSATAMSVLVELSPGGALMQSFSQQQLHQLVPDNVQLELKNLYNAACELLRHFWSCFPVNTPLLEEKIVRMRTNLEKFQLTKVKPFKEKLQPRHYSLNLCTHIEELLRAAYSKFNTWQTRKASRK